MNFICFQQEDGPLEEGGPPRGRGRGRGFSRGGLRGGFRGGFSRGRGGFRGGRGNKKLLFGKSSFIIELFFWNSQTNLYIAYYFIVGGYSPRGGDGYVPRGRGRGRGGERGSSRSRGRGGERGRGRGGPNFGMNGESSA
jgi:hypothetical protein